MRSIAEKGTGSRVSGIINAVLSSSTFGFAPFFSVSLMAAGLSAAEVLTYRWGTATAALALFALIMRRPLPVTGKQFGKIFLLSIFRAGTSASLLVAYSNIASGAASVIHFMYPVAVAIGMMLFTKERKSPVVMTAIAISIIGACLLAGGDSVSIEGGNTSAGIIFAVISVFCYSGYMILMKTTGADKIEPTALTCLVMGLGALFFFIAAQFTSGMHLVRDPELWLYILGLGIVATTISNFTLVKAIGQIGPTLTSVFGALEPLTAVVMGAIFFSEKLTLRSVTGIILILVTVTIVVMHQKRQD